jgi:type I restriction enzyme S subunit
MVSEWKKYKLGEITNWTSGGTPTKNNKEYWQGTIPWISASSMNGNRYFNSQLKITEKGLGKSRIAPKESILLLVRGSILHQKIQVGITLKELAFNQDVKCLAPKKEVINPWYLLYWFLANEKRLLGKVENTGIGAGKLDTSLMKNLEVNLPSIHEQNEIIKFTKTLDDKIELNRQMNQTLEQMAQALFKSWFVDFDPVLDNALAEGNKIPDTLKGKSEKCTLIASETKQSLPNHIQKLFPSEFEFNKELDKWIPKGWEVGALNKIAEVKYGKDHKKLEEGDIPVYGSGGLMRKVNQSLYSGESVLIPRKGTLSNIMYVNETFWTVDTMFFTIIKMPKHARYLYYSLKKLNFDEMNVGSAVPSMTTQVLNNLNILLPKQEAIEEFDSYLTDYYDKIEANRKQIQSLTQLRDTLLPKLISGDIRVADINSHKK